MVSDLGLTFATFRANSTQNILLVSLSPPLPVQLWSTFIHYGFSWAIPFVLILISIAVFPLAAPAWWFKNYALVLPLCFLSLRDIVLDARDRAVAGRRP